MASPENQQQNPNPAPLSLSAGDPEMHDNRAAQDASRPPSQQEPYLTPYLGLRARLSQTWINRWTILLLLVLIRTLFAIASLDNNIGAARKQALSACTSVENVGSAMASLPHYLSDGVNELTAKGITKAVNGLMSGLLMSITGVEEIVIFIINLLTSTYVCLITLAVSGGLHVAVQVAEDVGNFLNSTVQDIGKDLGSAATDLQKALNGFVSDIDKIGSVISGHQLTPPTVNFSTDITRLNSLQLPQGYDHGLKKLNASIPTFAQVQNFTNHAISLPFEELKTLVNNSLPKHSMNSSLFPTPERKQLTFCSDNNGVNAFFDNLVDIEHFCKKIFLIVIITLAILAMIPMGYMAVRRYRFQKMQSNIVRSDAYDPMDSVYIASRPYTAYTGLKIAHYFKSSRRQALVRWSIAYATTVPALFVLSLALAGLLGCLTQYILLKAIEKEVPALENMVVDFADKVIHELDDASKQWAVGVNGLIEDANSLINKDILGWVNTSTTAVNKTLNIFVDDMVGALNDTFGGTVLYTPILDVMDCLVLLKIRGIENGLTWISEHAYVEFPELPNNTFSLGTVQKVSGSHRNILATGPNGTAANDITEAVNFVTGTITRAIRQEAIISTCVLLVWVIIALIGIGRALVLMVKGGDADTYAGHYPKYTPPPIDEKLELDNFSRVPTYEQATAAPAMDAAADSHAGNKFNGHVYTLTPNPLPTFEINTAASPILSTGFRSPRDNKLGTVSGKNVDLAIRRPTHIRASSHGDYGITSPTSGSPPCPNPFLSIEEKYNPFTDPSR